MEEASGRTADEADGPARRYYEACVGAWRAPMQLDVHDPAALRASGMGALDRLSVRLLALWPRWLGRVFLDTTVSFDPDGRVVHTTDVRWLGVPMKRSVERYRILADGRRLEVSGDMTGSGEVDATATGATYTLRWLGVTIAQHTEREPDRVTVHQEGPGFRGVQVLVRR